MDRNVSVAEVTFRGSSGNASAEDRSRAVDVSAFGLADVKAEDGVCPAAGLRARTARHMLRYHRHPARAALGPVAPTGGEPAARHNGHSLDDCRFGGPVPEQFRLAEVLQPNSMG